MKPSRLALLCVLFCVMGKSVAAELTEVQQIKLGVRTSPLLADDVIADHRYLGQVQYAPNSQQILSKPYNLQVMRWLVSLGDQVHTGQTLADIYVPDMVAVEHEYHRLISAVKLAKQKQQREQTLIQQGVVSQKQYQQTQAEYSQLQEQLDTVSNQLRLMGVSADGFAILNRDQHLNGRVTLNAPCVGVVSDISAGVNQSLPANEGLISLITDQSLLVHIPVSVDSAQSIAVGQALRLENGTPLSVQTIQPQVSDAQKRVVIARVQADQLKAGQWVKVIFPSQGKVPQWRVARQSITYIDNQPHLLVLTNHQISAIAVSLISSTREGWVVEGEGLSTETQVVVSGTSAVKAVLNGGE